jgi:hypothetical protein
VELHCDTSHSLIADSRHSLALSSILQEATDRPICHQNQSGHALKEEHQLSLFSSAARQSKTVPFVRKTLFSDNILTILLGSLPTLTTKDHRTRPLFLFSHLGPEISTDHFHQINHQEIIIRSSRRIHLFGIPVNLPINPQHKLSQLAVLPSRQPSAHPGHNHRDCLPLIQQPPQ